jgi:trigger factor
VKSTVENLSPTRVRLAVEVPFEELKPSLDAAYKKIGSQVRIPGFRPGKVPARIIDQRVGRAAVLEEAINAALPGVYTEAAREHEIKPISQPDIDVTNVDDGTSLIFTAEVDVRPEVTLPELDGLAVTVDDVAVTDEDVDEQLDSLRERFGTLVGVERAVHAGDFVSLDLTASVDGQEVEAGSAKGLSYEVGSGDLIDGLDDAILGKLAGESATFTTTLRQGEQAGAEADITATVNSVRRRSCLPSTTSSRNWRVSSTPSTSSGKTCAAGSAAPRRSSRARRHETRCWRSCWNRSSSRCRTPPSTPRSNSASTRSCTPSATTTTCSSVT